MVHHLDWMCERKRGGDSKVASHLFWEHTLTYRHYIIIVDPPHGADHWRARWRAKQASVGVSWRDSWRVAARIAVTTGVATVTPSRAHQSNEEGLRCREGRLASLACLAHRPTTTDARRSACLANRPWLRSA